MGSMLKAECRCGFQKGFSAGGGMKNFQTHCAVPALCEKCSDLVIINYLGKKRVCHSCKNEIKIYNSPELQKSDDDSNTKDVFSWKVGNETFTLQNTKYFCPKCGKFEMRFIKVGFFD